MEAALLLFHAVLSLSQHSWGLSDCTEQDPEVMFALRAPYQEWEQHPGGNGGISLGDFSKHSTSPAQVGASMEWEMCCAWEESSQLHGLQWEPWSHFPEWDKFLEFVPGRWALPRKGWAVGWLVV